VIPDWRRLWKNPLLLAGALWAVVCVAVGVHLAGQAPDDMFISFRYAWNLAHGQGLVFNPGERVFGLTNPGLALLLALLHAVTRAPVHVLAGVVFGSALWVVAVLLLGEGIGRGRTTEAVVAGSLLVSSSVVWANQGSASASVLALLALAAVLAASRPVSSGIAAGLAVWFRPDAVLAVAGLGLLLTLERRPGFRRWLVAVSTVVGVGMVAAWWWFGALLPATLEAKRLMAAAWAGSWAGPARFWARGATLLGKHWGPAWLLCVTLGVAGLWPLFTRGGRAVRTLTLYAAGVALAYPLLGVPYFSWYAVPVYAVLLYGLVAFVASLARAWSRAVGGDRPRSTPAVRALSILLALLLGGLPVLSLERSSLRWLTGGHGGGRFATYRKAALWIAKHSDPGARIAFGEIGNLAYWSRRPVDDLLGLVTPRSLPYLAAGDPVGAFLARPPKIFLHHPKAPFMGIVELPWFRRAYRPVARIAPPPDGEGEVVVYRRRPGVPLPPPRPPGKASSR